LLRGALPAWPVFAIALSGTALAGYLSYSDSERETEQRFETEIAAVQVDLTERLRAYEQVLRGGVSVFHSWPSVTRDNWRRFVEHLQISGNYPGIQGIGFAPAPADMAERRQRLVGKPLIIAGGGLLVSILLWAAWTLASNRAQAAALVVARDITQSKRAEKALKESEAAARGVLDAALDAYVRMDEAGRITEWNLMAERTFGWPRHEAIGRPLDEVLIPPARRDAHRRGLARFLAVGEGRLLNRRIELQALHRSGRAFPVEITILAVKTNQGHVFSAFLRDLTEKKQAEAQLRQAQKMEAVGQLTGGIAHDFNNLLTVIIGNLELVGTRDPGDSSLASFAGQALAAAEKGAELTHRLLAFSRQQTLQPIHTDLKEMINGMIELLRRTLGEDIEIEVRLAEDLWPELADKSQVENALLNLAINSRDAMPEGGKLTIEAGNVTLDADYAERNVDVEPGDYVLLAVTDAGTGMPPDVVERAFDPFFTTKETGKGTGLGLSMIYGFARQSGGHLKIYSEVGHGTTVKLYLPRAPTVPPAAPAPDVPQKHIAGTETILVVEDEDAVRKLVVRHLRSLDYRVIEAAEGATAAELLRGDEKIDLLFTDVVLPGGMTGRQLAEEARALRPDLRVLFTSGYTHNSIVHQGKLDFGVHLLSKPYRREDLGRKIREVLGADKDR
jgi:PAS domain S-box-containing protein